jgi:LmbE family N-acetylglucosaminyl deacetylase
MPSLARRLHSRSRALRERYRDGRLRPTLRPDPDAPALLLSPHLDDGVLDCWALLSGAGALNVVNVFAGSPAGGRLPLWDAITGASDSVSRMAERRAEDALALQGASRQAHCLGLLDAQYRSPPPPQLRELDRAVCEASHVYAAAGLGGHPDHLLVRRYARALLAAGMAVTLYAELPYCVMHGWPHWVDGRPQDPYRDVDAHWRPFLDGVPELPGLRAGKVVRLSDEQAAAKLQAMRCYRSQLPALDYGGRELVLADPEIHRYEVSWTLTSRGSPTA